MIQLKIHRESDFYNPLDPSQTIIHNEVLKYLKSSCAGSSPKEHRNDTLQIYCDGPMDTDKAKRAIEDAVRKDCADFDRKIASVSHVDPGFRLIWIASVFEFQFIHESATFRFC